MEKVSGMSVVALCWGLCSDFEEDLPTNNDPARQIRFLNAEEAQEISTPCSCSRSKASALT